MKKWRFFAARRSPSFGPIAEQTRLLTSSRTAGLPFKQDDPP
jgi:hypothetical protein